MYSPADTLPSPTTAGLQLSCDPTLTPGGSTKAANHHIATVSAVLVPRGATMSSSLSSKHCPILFGFHSTFADKNGSVSSFVFCQMTTGPKQISVKKKKKCNPSELRTVSLLNSKLWQGTQDFISFFFHCIVNNVSDDCVIHHTYSQRHYRWTVGWGSVF